MMIEMACLTRSRLLGIILTEGKEVLRVIAYPSR